MTFFDLIHGKEKKWENDIYQKIENNQEVNKSKKKTNIIEIMELTDDLDTD